MTTIPNQYPIGKFQSPATFIQNHTTELIKVIARFPVKIREETSMLNDEQLDTPYRKGGWTIRQVVHHVADSHMNAYIRFKLTLTEQNPTIKPYMEEKWAETVDGKSAPIWISLNLLDALHKRWDLFLNSFKEDDFLKTYSHPDLNKEFKMYEAIALYAWHCEHHLAHITTLKSNENWY